MSMLDYLAETDLFRAYQLTLTLSGAGKEGEKVHIRLVSNVEREQLLPD